MRRVMPRAAAAVVAVLLVGVGSASVAMADPGPSAGDVAQAQAAVAGAATAVATIELELAVQQSELDASWTAVDAAGEAYTQGIVDRDAARAASSLAADQLEAARTKQEAARADLGSIALEAYRSGASMDGASALLSADGLDDYLARSTAIDKLGQRAESAVQRFEAARSIATTLGSRAAAAAAEAEVSATRAQAALDAATAAQAAAEAKVAQVAARRTELITELAARRSTSVAIERQRQDALDAERAARADAAARAARAAVTPIASTPTRVVPAPEPVPTATSTRAPVTGTAGPTATTPPVAAAPEPTATPTTPPQASTLAPAPAPSDPYGLGTGSQRGSAAQGRAAVAWATAQAGKPYVWGAAGADSFDCSGLTSQAWRAAGVSINRTSRDQYRQVRKISYGEMRPGDLLFWGSDPSNPSSITHVAMFVGGNQMVEAPRPGVQLRVTSIRWAGTMSYAGRP